MKFNRTGDYDDIPVFLLSDSIVLHAVLPYPLIIIFNLSLNTQLFRDAWKSSIITPVFKCAVRNKVVNYRPISLICNFVKIFTMVLQAFLLFNVRSNIIDLEHGFLTSHFVSNSFDAKLQVDMICTDFSKAFDKINHLAKLHNLGFSDCQPPLKLSYLSNRSQCVKYCGQILCQIRFWLHRVRQGTIFGSLFFDIYINDVVKPISSSTVIQG